MILTQNMTTVSFTIVLEFIEHNWRPLLATLSPAAILFVYILKNRHEKKQEQIKRRQTLVTLLSQSISEIRFLQKQISQFIELAGEYTPETTQRGVFRIASSMFIESHSLQSVKHASLNYIECAPHFDCFSIFNEIINGNKLLSQQSIELNSSQSAYEINQLSRAQIYTKTTSFLQTMTAAAESHSEVLRNKVSEIETQINLLK